MPDHAAAAEVVAEVVVDHAEVVEVEVVAEVEAAEVVEVEDLRDSLLRQRHEHVDS